MSDTNDIDQGIWLEAVDRSRNIARRYSIEISPDLFGLTIVEYRWGRIGARGQSKRVSFGKDSEAQRFAHQLLKRRAGAHKRIGVRYLKV